MSEPIEIAAPCFEDFTQGMEFDAPAVTMTSGLAAWRQALTGDRLRLPLDHPASRALTGCDRPLVHPLSVIDVAIGQSTWASQRVKANLFYRGLVLSRPVFEGDTLHTRTRVVGLRQNRPQAGRPASGLVVLEMLTLNQDAEEVLRVWRCPMIPCRDPAAETGRGDDLDGLGAGALEPRIRAAVPSTWKSAGVTAAWSGRKAADLVSGMRFRVEARDTVTLAPELVRLTLNMAMVHTDSRDSYLGERLVYGGHTLGIAFAQLTRALPNLLTVLAWESVVHAAPVCEGDRLRSEITVLALAPEAVGATAAGTPLKLLIKTYAARGAAAETESHVLDWTVWVLSA